jgi:hypothetical protein
LNRFFERIFFGLSVDLSSFGVQGVLVVIAIKRAKPE